MPERLFLLAIETTSSETGAAVLEGLRPPGAASRSSVRAWSLADQPAQTVWGRGPQDRTSPRPSALARDRRGAPTRRGRPDRPEGDHRHHPPRPGRCARRGPDRGQDAGPDARHPLVAVGHLEGHLYACRLRRPRPRHLPLPGAGRLGGAHPPLLMSRPTDVKLLGGAKTTRPARHSTRWPASSASAIPRPRDGAAAPGGNPSAFAYPRPCLHDDGLPVSFSGQDGRPVSLRGPDARTRGRRLLPISWRTSPRASRRRPSTS